MTLSLFPGKTEFYAAYPTIWTTVNIKHDPRRFLADFIRAEKNPTQCTDEFLVFNQHFHLLSYLLFCIFKGGFKQGNARNDNPTRKPWTGKNQVIFFQRAAPFLRGSLFLLSSFLYIALLGRGLGNICSRAAMMWWTIAYLRKVLLT